MNSTPPIAFLITSLVLGAVWPMYCPTRSSRVTATRWPLRTYPRRCRMVAIRMATVVLPVPGLPVKHMCRLGPPAVKPRSRRSRSTSSTARVSRIRVGAPWFFLPDEPEAGFVRGSVHDEGQRDRFNAVGGIKRRYANVVPRECLPAAREFLHDAGRVAKIEHRRAVHLPERVARMRIVGVFDRDRPALVQAVRDLPFDLVVGRVRQIRKRALGQTHDVLLLGFRGCFRRPSVWLRNQA